MPLHPGQGSLPVSSQVYRCPELYEKHTTSRLAILLTVSVGQGIADPGTVELADDEVLALVERFGFRIERRESGIDAGYIQDPSSMLQSLYRVSHWVARKI
jgi:hypothetical protein